MGNPDVNAIRVVIDPDTAISIASLLIVPAACYALLAPTLLRSHVLDNLYDRVRKGDLTEQEGQALNANFAKLKIRFLGDAVMRRRAWAIAKRKALKSTAIAEYLSLTQLQADALATEDENFIKAAEGIVPVLNPLSLQMTE